MTLLIVALNQIKNFTFCEFNGIWKLSSQKRCLHFQNSLFSHKMTEYTLSSTLIQLSISLLLWLEKKTVTMFDMVLGQLHSYSWN